MKPDFGAFVDELSDTLRRKSARRGTANVTGPAQVTARIDDKLARLKHDLEAGATGELDDWLDVAGHAAIGWLIGRGLWDDREALRTVYLAHKTNTMIDFLIGLFRGYGFATFDPVRAFNNAKGYGEWIWQTNLAALRGADLVCAYMDEPATGVGAEIVIARLLNKPVWVYTPTQYASSTVTFAASRIFRSTEEIRLALEEVRGARRDEIPANPAS
jgi:hypothetical protein